MNVSQGRDTIFTGDSFPCGALQIQAEKCPGEIRQLRIRRLRNQKRGPIWFNGRRRQQLDSSNRVLNVDQLGRDAGSQQEAQS